MKSNSALWLHWITSLFLLRPLCFLLPLQICCVLFNFVVCFFSGYHCCCYRSHCAPYSFPFFFNSFVVVVVQKTFSHIIIASTPSGKMKTCTSFWLGCLVYLHSGLIDNKGSSHLLAIASLKITLNSVVIFLVIRFFYSRNMTHVHLLMGNSN